MECYLIETDPSNVIDKYNCMRPCISQIPLKLTYMYNRMVKIGNCNTIGCAACESKLLNVPLINFMTIHVNDCLILCYIDCLTLLFSVACTTYI